MPWLRIPKYVAQNIIVSLDFDGVIAHGLEVKLKYAKKWFGVNLSLEQTKEKGFNELMRRLGRKDINYRSLMNPLNEKHIMEYKVPFGCRDALSKLFNEGFRFVVVTSRNDHDFPYAIKFIKYAFGDIIKYIHNTRNESKGGFIRKLKPRVHVDDDLKKLLQIEGFPVELLYYRQPENYHENVPVLHRSKIIEIKDWNQFYTFLHVLKEIHEAICWFNKWENKYSNIGKIYTYYKSLSRSKLTDLLNNYRKNV